MVSTVGQKSVKALCFLGVKRATVVHMHFMQEAMDTRVRSTYTPDFAERGPCSLWLSLVDSMMSADESGEREGAQRTRKLTVDFSFEDQIMGF